MKTKIRKQQIRKTLDHLMGMREPTELERRQEEQDINCDNIGCKEYGEKPICYNPIFRDCEDYENE